MTLLSTHYVMNRMQTTADESQFERSFDAFSRIFDSFLIDCRILCKNALAAHQLKTFTRLPQQMTMFTTSQLNAPVTLKLTKPSGIENLPYEEKNALLKREQSPHLTIYKPQLTSMLSITHRMTGTQFRMLNTIWNNSH